MLVIEAGEDAFFGDVAQGIERDEKLWRGAERLQAVHPVADREPAVMSGPVRQIVPARPSGAPARHEPGIAMEHGLVARIAEGAEQAALLAARLGQHGERVVGVRGDDDLIEAPGDAARVEKRDARGVALDAPDRRSGQDAVGEGRAEAADIFAAAADHRPPLRPFGELQQAVICAKAHESRGRIIADFRRRRRPDRRRHRKKVVLAEGRAETAPVEIGAETFVAHVRIVARRLAIEAQELPQHGPESRAQEIGLLRKQTAEVRTRIFDAAGVERNGEGHFGGRGRNAEKRKKRGQIGIAGLVIDDEAGVYGDAAAPRFDLDRVGMTADAVIGLEHGDVMGERQKPGGGKSGYARADDGDLLPASVPMQPVFIGAPLSGLRARRGRMTVTSGRGDRFCRRREKFSFAAVRLSARRHVEAFVPGGRPRRERPGFMFDGRLSMNFVGRWSRRSDPRTGL